ncbi:NAD(P)-binding domain protein [Metarhizium rileyi]|uniref:NAD(P)-binding domain protein n=1 Tax=Metarhizium rileyi (strain RCEF 4871) TaxID=1649241 RepID=A0A167KPT2_METRR|nr:NAD(P)-binding domain protein [Metarhizium rileyi RCEF 4871]
MSVIRTVIGQFKALPYPDEDCTGWTVIVTGSNTGLGLEAARHFVRLNATKVIIACRNADKGAAAKIDIENSTQRQGVMEVWHLDLCSSQSVKDFAARAALLDRLDVLLNNASILVMDHALHDGYETMTQVNVLSTLLLTLLLLPKLRQTATTFSVMPRVTIVSSFGAFYAFFPQRHARAIFEELKKDTLFSDRYTTTKLLQLMVMRSLAAAVDASDKGHVLVNAVNPGLCSTELFRHLHFPLNVFLCLAVATIARDSEMGSRALMAGVFAKEMHGKFMSNCKEETWPRTMVGQDGKALDDRVWGELLGIMEGVEAGVTGNI